MTPPIRIPTRPLADAVAEHLEGLIREGVLRPGERLASERELSEQLGVSRPSLRDALEKLGARGLLDTGATGTFVARFLDPLLRPLAEVLGGDGGAVSDYFEYRVLVEAPAARLAAARATAADRSAIRDCMAALATAHEKEDPAEEIRLDAELHLLIYEAAHNLVVLHVMRGLSEMLRADVFFGRGRIYAVPGARARLFAQHRAITDAILERNGERAEAAAAAHIGFAAETLATLHSEDARLARALRRSARVSVLGRRT